MKKLIRWAVPTALVVWVIQDPASAASLAHHAWSGLIHVGHSLSHLANGIG